MVKILIMVLAIAITLGGTIPGDVNFDNKVNVIDLTIVSHYMQGRYRMTDYQKQMADVNFDGVIDTRDLDKIIDHIMRR